MRYTLKGKIAKDGKYLTSSDDIRLEWGSNGWGLTGFAHNPDGKDIKDGQMEQGADHYGHKAGEVVAVRLIDMPQFWSVDAWPTLDAVRADIHEGVPLSSKWGYPADHFGKHIPITFRFLDRESYGDCILYDIQVVDFSW